MQKTRKNGTRDIIITAFFIALASAIQIAKNYLLPGVEFVTLVIFIAGNEFGAAVGFLVGALTPLAYSLFLGMSPVIFFVASAFAVQGAIASFIRTENRIYLALVGVAYALAFDIWTNLGFALVYRVPLQIAFLHPLTLQIMLVHLIFNALIFGIVLMPIKNIIHARRVLK
jgi:hypothetical protein